MRISTATTVILIIVLATPAAAQRAGQYRTSQYYVIDGDTISRGKERIRIVGLDAPEIRDALCEQERIAGLRAKRVLRNILQHRDPVIERRGTDRYRRTLAVVKVDGRDVADIMIERGLASEERKDWCPGGIDSTTRSWSSRLRNYLRLR